MKITLVRCGQTEDDLLQKIHDSNNNLLSDSGRRQCQKLKFYLKEKNYDYCYMSPLISCVETAMILVGDRVETVPDSRLIERDMGELKGRPLQEYNAYKFWDYDLNRNDYGVEAVQDLFKRCQDFLDYILKKHAGSDILIVTDEEVYRALRYLLKGHKLEGNLLDGAIDYCKVEEFTV